jgi:predicted metal-dependent HD superfamily phosphohydrolase
MKCEAEHSQGRDNSIDMQPDCDFQELWQRLTKTEVNPCLIRRLLEAYQQPQRTYHNFHHIESCLSEFAQTKDLARHPECIEYAIWFHDSIYDTHASDNEVRSADWACQELAQAGVPEEPISVIRGLILATQHAGLLIDPDEQLLADIDLAIFGKSTQEFDEYDQLIHAEYAWVDPVLYRNGRSEVLKKFLSRPMIYQTSHYRIRFEQQARQNLQRALIRLAG